MSEALAVAYAALRCPDADCPGHAQPWHAELEDGSGLPADEAEERCPVCYAPGVALHG